MVRGDLLQRESLLKHATLNKTLITVISGILFFVTTMLFRQHFNIMAVMGIRPSALPPVFGLMLGPFGVLGCAIGNLAADIVSGYSVLVSALGFVAQFTYGILPYLMWKSFDELRNKPSTPVNFINAGNVIRYVVIILINAVIMTAFLGSIIHNLGASRFISNPTLMLLLNNIVFCIVIGIPIIILMSAIKSGIKGISLSMNERLVLIFLVAGIVSGGIIGIFVVRELSYAIADPVTMWMRIYMYIAINLIAFYMIAIVFLLYCERKITIPVESIADIARSFVSGDGERKITIIYMNYCKNIYELLQAAAYQGFVI